MACRNAWGARKMWNPCKRIFRKSTQNQQPVVIDIADDFVNWLYLAIATAGFHRGNLYCFDFAI